MASERRGLAYHEAGHAAVACALGLRVIEVSIGMDGCGSNHTRLDPDTPPSLPQALVINRGGVAAEHLFQAPAGSMAGLLDRHQAEKKILKHLKRKKSAALHEAYQRARRLLEANKAQTIEVAEHLIEHGRIDATAADRLLPFKGRPD